MINLILMYKSCSINFNLKIDNFYFKFSIFYIEANIYICINKDIFQVKINSKSFFNFNTQNINSLFKSLY